MATQTERTLLTLKNVQVKEIIVRGGKNIEEKEVVYGVVWLTRYQARNALDTSMLQDISLQ